MLNRPMRESVILKCLPKPVWLNFFTLADEEWAKDRFGGMPQLFETLKTGTASDYLELLWRMMDDDSKRMVANAKLVKWDGLVEKPLVEDDPVARLKLLFGGMEEARAVSIAIIATITQKSWPEIQSNHEKKKLEAEPLKTPKSSSSSRANTNTRASKSSG